MKIMSLFIILVFVTIVSGFFFWRGDDNCLIINQDGYWNLEIARTSEEHAQGLMNRRYLCPRCGMLFVFPNEQPQTFWMKNTYIPLDIYFYDRNGHIVDKVLNMRPMSETGSPMMYTSRAAQYVIEVNKDEKGVPDTIYSCI